MSLVGYLAMTISAGTVVSSLFSGTWSPVSERPKVTIVSVFMTAAGSFGLRPGQACGLLVPSGHPLGLGAGGVDAALNNFVACTTSPCT